MKSHVQSISAICALLAFTLSMSLANVYAEETYRSPLAVAVKGKLLYTADFTAKQVSIFSLSRERTRKTIPLPNNLTWEALGKKLEGAVVKLL